MTLRRKLLFHTYVLTALLILAMSLTYYYLFTRGIRERSQQNVTMTFTQIFDDLTTRVRDGQAKVEHLVSVSLVNPLTVIQMFQEQQTSEQTVSLWHVKRVMTYLQTIITEFREFGRLIDASEILLYGKEGNLQVIYRDEGDSQITGLYFPEVNPEQLIPLHPNDLWYATLQDLTEIPLQAFPPDLSPVYPETMPELMTVMFAISQHHLTIRFQVPIFIEGMLQGLCIIHLGLQQKDVERYARLSGTEVNLFAGMSLSVGTLPEYRTLPANMMDSYHAVDFLDLLETPPVRFSETVVAGRSFYQGLLAIGNETSPIGGIAVHYSRQLETKEKQAFFLVVVTIAVVFSVLAIAEAIGFSAMIVRPITRLMMAMQEIKDGNFQVKAPVETKDEIGRLADTFNTMTTQLKRHRDHLEELVKERTNELSIANQQLQELNVSKDKFFSIISHDLRSPFITILTLTQFLSEQPDISTNTEVNTKVAFLKTSAERLYGLLENLLTWARIQRGAMPYEPEVFDMFEIAEENIAIFESKAEHKNITLSSSIQENTLVYADFAMTNTIMRNLISNALKFTEAEGKITLSVVLQEEYIEAAVSDTGCGIDTDGLAMLFQLDTQFTTVGTAGEQGTGLGLILCKELVEQNGGRIWVESEVGTGTTFRFSVPRQPKK